MKIAAIQEKQNGEYRTSVTPDTVKIFLKNNFEVVLEKDIGKNSNFIDSEYEKNGGRISSVPLEILSDADIILKVQPSDIKDKFSEAEFAKEGSVIIGFFSPHQNQDLIKYYASKRISLLSMELVPRTTKAQSFDALSSQSNLVGYRAVIDAANYFSKAFPMFMTAAGTIQPAKVLVLGAGVAGLQAVATAKRLGASVFAYDVRLAAKEQVESLGGKFLHPDSNISDQSSDSGYAKEVDSEFATKQNQMLEAEISKFDIVITTAQIPGKKAPVLITKKMVSLMKKGSVIVDIAASSGGNCEHTKSGSVVSIDGVNIVGYNNFSSKIASSSSALYARNLANLVTYLFKDKTELDLKDDIVKSMLLTHNGEILFGK
jgi:H+-translocating NAD(P) transhydrogenase subunit alpha